MRYFDDEESELEYDDREWDTDELGIDPEELYDDATDDILDRDDS